MSNILVVEDEAHLAEGLRFNLEAEGYQVEVVDTGEAALELFDGKKPDYDVVVLDVMLPGKDGFEVISEAGRPVCSDADADRARASRRCSERLQRRG
jgi:two-component system alkaline phosphatase synthesis response regulator PhoP